MLEPAQPCMLSQMDDDCAHSHLYRPELCYSRQRRPLSVLQTCKEIWLLFVIKLSVLLSFGGSEWFAQKRLQPTL